MFKNLFCGILIAANCSLYGSATTDVFKRFLTDNFVETGSYTGVSIDQAKAAGYKEIYSVELSDKYYKHCRKRFGADPHIHLYHGDSATMMPFMIKDITSRCTFWLDGHFSDGDTAKGNTYTPLIGELEAIKAHPIKTHTILIDDIRLLNTFWMDNIRLMDLVNMLLSINPNYVVTFEDGYAPNDILVAYLPEK